MDELDFLNYFIPKDKENKIINEETSQDITTDVQDILHLKLDLLKGGEITDINNLENIRSFLVFCLENNISNNVIIDYIINTKEFVSFDDFKKHCFSLVLVPFFKNNDINDEIKEDIIKEEIIKEEVYSILNDLKIQFPYEFYFDMEVKSVLEKCKSDKNPDLKQECFDLKIEFLKNIEYLREIFYFFEYMNEN